MWLKYTRNSLNVDINFFVILRFTFEICDVLAIQIFLVSTVYIIPAHPEDHQYSLISKVHKDSVHLYTAGSPFLNRWSSYTRGIVLV